MKKLLSTFFVAILSGAGVFAFGGLDNNPGNNGTIDGHDGNNGNNGGNNTPNSPYFPTEPVGPNRPRPIPLSYGVHTMYVQDCLSGNTFAVRIGLGMVMDAPVDHNDMGTYAFYLYVDEPLTYPVQVMYVNQTTGETYYVTLEAGSRWCGVPLGNALGSWMVQFGSNYGCFTVTSDQFYGGIDLH